MVDNITIDDLERYNRLLEIYGKLLSERARSIVKDYIAYGLSITEIAETRNVSKQSVSTTIRRALHNLDRYERLLGMLSLIEMLEDHCPEIVDRWQEHTERGKA